VNEIIYKHQLREIHGDQEEDVSTIDDEGQNLRLAYAEELAQQSDIEYAYFMDYCAWEGSGKYQAEDRARAELDYLENLANDQNQPEYGPPEVRTQPSTPKQQRGYNMQDEDFEIKPTQEKKGKRKKSETVTPRTINPGNIRRKAALQKRPVKGKFREGYYPEIHRHAVDESDSHDGAVSPRAKKDLKRAFTDAQKPTPSDSPAKMQRALRENPAVTPVKSNNNAEAVSLTPTSPWTAAGSPGNLDAYLGYGALHQASPPRLNLNLRFDSPVRAQAPVQRDAYDIANETLLNFIQQALENENIDTTEMLRVVTEAKTSVSNALKALPKSSAQLAEVYQEFLGKLNPFIGLINERQRQAEPLNSQDLVSFLMTLSALRQTVKAGL